MNAFDELLLAAHHEAGHAVVGFKLGASVGALKVNGVQLRNLTMAWGDDAEADVDPTGLVSDKIAQIALAGPWAGIKFQGYAHARIRPNTHATVEPDCTRAVIDAMTCDANNPDDPPKDIRATLVVGVQSHTYCARLGDSAQDIATARNHTYDLTGSVIDTLALINNHDVWAMIMRLALELAGAPEDKMPGAIGRAIFQKQLSRERVAWLLTNVI